MNRPLVSVVLSVYNAEKYIGEAIESILVQSYENFELIIINDGSTDKSLEIISAFNDNRILLINRENKGLIASLNEGISRAQGAYIARMDADDIAMTERLAVQVDFMHKHPDIGICGTALHVFGENTHEHVWKLPLEDKYIKAQLLFSSALAHPTVMMRKSLIDHYRLTYNPSFKHAEDYELWTRFSHYTKMANLPEVLLKYRVLEHSASRAADKEVQERYAVMKNIPMPYLHKLGIKKNEKQAWLHFNLSTNLRMKESKVDFGEMSEYFALLLQANENKNIFDHTSLRYVMGKKWLINLVYRCNIRALFSRYTFWGIAGVLKR